MVVIVRSLFIIMVSFMLTLSPIVATASTQLPQRLKVYFLDVGQGDAILLIFPNHKSMLVDGGPPEHAQQLISKIHNYGVKKLDLVVSTHPDIDHIGGLISVIQEIPVKRIMDSGKRHDSFTYYSYLKSVHSKQVPFYIAREGQYIPLDPMVSIRVLNNGEEKRENNESSIILKVSFGNADFLLTGDADVEIEERVAEKYDVRADVLKVGHHGSYTSSSSFFLKQVQPTFAVITYEHGNDYNHPHRSVVNRLKKNNIQILRTAKLGDIKVETDGLTLRINEGELVSTY
ncbi:MAG: ComEC/Rec2 family competence protein [Bacillaceae bacterium]